MSRTLSTNKGSLDSLNVSERCGCSPKAAHIRRIVVCEKPVAVAIERIDPCVASSGGGARGRSLPPPVLLCAAGAGRVGPRPANPRHERAGSAAATCRRYARARPAPSRRPCLGCHRRPEEFSGTALTGTALPPVAEPAVPDNPAL